MSEKLCQSYVFHKGKEYFVSTINRKSSSIYPIVYAETLVWEYNREKNERGNIVGQDEDHRDSIKTHLEIVKRIFRTGKFED